MLSRLKGKTVFIAFSTAETSCFQGCRGQLPAPSDGSLLYLSPVIFTLFPQTINADILVILALWVELNALPVYVSAILAQAGIPEA